MDKRTAIVLFLIGMLLFLASCAPIAYVIYYATVIDPYASISLVEPDTFDEFPFQASPGTLAQFKVEANIATSSVQEDPDNIFDAYDARFRFPISYSITDAGGNLLVSEDVVMAWKDGGSISKSNEKTTSTGGTLTASISLNKFIVPTDGYFKISIKISSDRTYEASYVSAKLHLYEGLIDNTWYVVSGVFMFFIGFILAMLGFIFVITSATQASIQQQNSEQDIVLAGELHDKNINQQAMFIQLSAFAGYIIPFGSIILPLVLWLGWREKDPYLDEMGREAVNFQLSMLLYYIICAVLFIVLIGMVLIFAVMIFHLTFIIVGAMQTSRGISYRYPMIIRFIRI